MEKDEEKRENVKDSILLATAKQGNPQPMDVDLRKGRPKEENWSYLIALLIPASILIVIILFVILR